MQEPEGDGAAQGHEARARILELLIRAGAFPRPPHQLRGRRWFPGDGDGCVISEGMVEVHAEHGFIAYIPADDLRDAVDVSEAFASATEVRDEEGRVLFRLPRQCRILRRIASPVDERMRAIAPFVDELRALVNELVLRGELPSPASQWQALLNDVDADLLPDDLVAPCREALERILRETAAAAVAAPVPTTGSNVDPQATVATIPKIGEQQEPPMPIAERQPGGEPPWRRIYAEPWIWITDAADQEGICSRRLRKWGVRGDMALRTRVEFLPERNREVICVQLSAVRAYRQALSRTRAGARRAIGQFEGNGAIHDAVGGGAARPATSTP